MVEILEVSDERRIGVDCGYKIAKLAKIIHPYYIAIIPLYRSCIVVMQSEKEKEMGECTIHSYADPNWLGEELDIETLKKDEFHTEFKIRGQKSSPEIIYEKYEKVTHFPISLGFEYLIKMKNGIHEWDSNNNAYSDI